MAVRVDATLDAIGLGRFHAIAIVALALTTSAQSMLQNAFAFLIPCVAAPLRASPSLIPRAALSSGLSSESDALALLIPCVAGASPPL